MSKESKKQEESLFISTQQEAQSKPQMLMPGQEQLEFNVEETFKCPIYISKKPEWVEPLNKASDPIIERLKKKLEEENKRP